MVYRVEGLGQEKALLPLRLNNLGCCVQWPKCMAMTQSRPFPLF